MASAGCGHWLAALDRVGLVLELDHVGHVVAANSQACRQLGYAQTDLIGRNLAIFRLSAATRTGLRRVRGALKHGETARLECEARTAAGAPIWLDATIFPWGKADSGKAGYTVLGLDITARKASEAALQHQVQLYRSTMMALGEGIVVLDASGQIISSNPAAERILQLRRDDLVGRTTADPVWQTIYEDGREFPADEHPANVALMTGLPQRDVVMGLRGADSRVTWICINAEPIVEPGDIRPTSVVTSFSDITARKQAQEVLREAVAAIPEGFVIYDDNDRLLMCNEAYREIYVNTAPAIRPGVTFRELVQYGLERGQYGEVGTSPESRTNWLNERVARHAHPSQDVLQQLGDGRWVQIRERRTPSGYIVGVRTDVTALKHHAATLQALIDNFPGGISFFDSRLQLVACNSQFRELLDLDPQLFASGMPSLEQIFRANAARGEYGPGDPEQQVRERLELAGKAEAHVFERARPDGTVLEVRGTPIPGGGFVTTYVDITARRLAEKLLTESERRAREKTAALQITLAHISQGLSMFDRHGRLMVWNDQYIEMYGMSDKVVRPGATIEEIIVHRQESGDFTGDPSAFVEQLREKLSQKHVFSTISRLRNGRIVTAINTPIAGGGWVSTHEDVTERSRTADQISHLARHDGLTGLANRAEFKARLEEALTRIAGSGDMVSVILIDLDRFKAVNDSLGHAAGDRLLQAVAERMKRSVRGGDVVARLGGDEFAILQQGRANLRDVAVRLAVRLIEDLGEPYMLEGRQAMIGASIGVAMGPHNGETADQLMRNADLALYKVKANGRSNCRVYDDALDCEARNQRELSAELRDAIVHGQLELHYQPILSLPEDRICGVEALVRWKHPIRGYIPPDTFIPMAEESGLIVQLGEWVIGRACADAVAWPEHVKIGINISPTHIQRGRLIDLVMRSLLKSRLTADRLEIEVTETVLLRQDEALLSELHQLKELGVSIVLDDFGTGFSSLSHLRMFAFDKIKIDKSFVAEITERADCVAIVCALTGLARNLGIKTTAEGIETPEQLQLLKAAGCSQGQGYLFGRPQPASALAKLFEAEAATARRQAR